MSKNPAEPPNTMQDLSGPVQDSAFCSVSDIPTKNPTLFKDDENISPHSKPCSLCSRRRDVLIRCQIDHTPKWNFICTGKCWNEVGGGKVDGDGSNTFYRYGGMWKNKHEFVSAKIKGKAKEKNRKDKGGVKSEAGGGDEEGG